MFGYLDRFVPRRAGMAGMIDEVERRDRTVALVHAGNPNVLRKIPLHSFVSGDMLREICGEIDCIRATLPMKHGSPQPRKVAGLS